LQSWCSQCTWCWWAESVQPRYPVWSAFEQLQPRISAYGHTCLKAADRGTAWRIWLYHWKYWMRSSCDDCTS
jgi:hypothetical protein